MSMSIHLDIGIEEITKSYVINIQYNAEIVIQYWGIITKYIDLGDTVESSQMIGECKEFIHVAYLSTTQAESHWPVRVGSVTYYTHDPELYITGGMNAHLSLYFYLSERNCKWQVL